MPLTDPRPGEDDDTGCDDDPDYDYYDAPSGNIRHPGLGHRPPGRRRSTTLRQAALATGYVSAADFDRIGGPAAMVGREPGNQG